jgi:hypothetical protein
VFVSKNQPVRILGKKFHDVVFSRKGCLLQASQKFKIEASGAHVGNDVNPRLLDGFMLKCPGVTISFHPGIWSVLF